MTDASRLDIVQLPRGDAPRTVRIYLPPGYDGSVILPVLYMFDGQNLFDPAFATFGKSWLIHETVDALVAADPGAGAVVVGIDSPYDGQERAKEMTIGEWDFPVVDYPEYAGRDPRIIGEGEMTAHFMAKVVKPYVESRYSVASDRQQVAVGGSSLGGYMSLYVMARYPELFGVVLAFSPAVFDTPMRGQVLREFLRTSRSAHRLRVYLDMGGHEELRYASDDIVGSLWPLTEAVVEAGYADVTTAVYPEAGHDEDAWAERFPGVYLWGLHGSELPAPPEPGPVQRRASPV